MKRIILVILIALSCTPCFAETRVTVTKNTDGVMSRVTAYVTESGQTVFKVDELGGVTLYVTNLIPLSGNSIYFIGRSVSGYYTRYNSSSSVTGIDTLDSTLLAGEISNSRLPDPVSVGVSGIQKEITGMPLMINLTGSETLQGNTMYGGHIGNYLATSEVTGTMTNAKKGMNLYFMNTQGQALGCTVVVKFNAFDTVYGLDSAFSTGNSVVLLSGVTLSNFLALESWADGKWWANGVSIYGYRNQ